MADWATISSLATAGGTLVLAVATFSSVRSANRSARVAELTLQESRRPVLVNSRQGDPSQTIGFADRHIVTVDGGGASVQLDGDGVYVVLSLRNVGSGIAVLQAWQARTIVDRMSAQEVPPVDEFRSLVRDQYIAAGDIGVWQAAVRDPDDSLHPMLVEAVTERKRFIVDLLYTDQVGGQRTISRFGITPEDDNTGWIAASARHWYLDAPAPR